MECINENRKFPRWHRFLQVIDKLPDDEWIDSYHLTQIIDMHFPQFWDKKDLKFGKNKTASNILGNLRRWNLLERKKLTVDEKYELFANKTGWQRDGDGRLFFLGRAPDYVYRFNDRGKKIFENYLHRKICPVCNKASWSKGI